jgi:hypothetical protein
MLVREVLSVSTPREDSMADTEKSPATPLAELAVLDPVQRHEVARQLRTVSETFAELPDGKTTSRVLGVLAHLLDPD